MTSVNWANPEESTCSSMRSNFPSGCEITSVPCEWFFKYAKMSSSLLDRACILLRQCLHSLPESFRFKMIRYWHFYFFLHLWFFISIRLIQSCVGDLKEMLKYILSLMSSIPLRQQEKMKPTWFLLTLELPYDHL